MAAGAIGLSRRISAHSGHFPASILSDETDNSIGMSSLHPVTFPSSRSLALEAEPQKLESQRANIDHTVQKLFASMSIAYNSRAQLAAPQFKAYKGLRITVKEKMRLNNIVWREWHLQFVKKRRNKKRAAICSFCSQMDEIHTSPTVMVLEGKYWKRSTEVVANEYMKWRVFYKERMKHWNPDSTGIPVDELLARVGREDHRTVSTFVQNQNIRAHYSPPELTKDDYKMDLSDSIFNTLQSVGFPHQISRDLLGLESSDLMQPGLIGLEPDLDFGELDSSEPLQDLLADVMNQHMEQFKFTSGQKRPVFQDSPQAPVLPMQPPPAYPAFKRSRSSNSQTPEITEQLLNELNVHLNNNNSLSCFNDDVSQVLNQAPAQPAYQHPQGSVSTTRDSRQLMQLLQPSHASQAHQGQLQQTSQQAMGVHSAHSPVLSVPDARSSPPPYYSFNHFSDSYSASSQSSTDPFYTAHSSYNHTPITSFSKPDAAPSLGSFSSSSDQCNFKKPETKPRIVKPNPEQKSSFLTQLLRKPLDKDGGAENTTTSFTSDQQSVHPVYFPQFTPISYTPQVSPADLQTSSFRYQDGRAVAGMDNISSPSEEDKKEGPTAEQKRRHQIKTGFEALSGLVPTIATTTTSKTSKATMLSKTLEFITRLQQEEKSMQQEMDILNSEIDALDQSIALCQGQLPATGIPMVSQHREHMRGMLQSYIVEQTQKNWRFYAFSKLTAPLFDSFYSTVSTTNIDDMYRSTQAWLDQHCSLVTLRPAMLGSLRDICGETEILTDPARFPEQAREAVMNGLRPAAETKPSADFKPPTEHRLSADFRSPTEHRLSADFRPPTEYRLSADCRPPTELRVSADFRPPAEHRPSADFRPPIEHRRSTDFRPPTELRVSADFRPPIEHRPSADFRPATEHRRSADFRQPAERRPSVDFRTPAKHMPYASQRPPT